jgi:hypothetical protein
VRGRGSQTDSVRVAGRAAQPPLHAGLPARLTDAGHPLDCPRCRTRGAAVIVAGADPASALRRVSPRMAALRGGAKSSGLPAATWSTPAERRHLVHPTLAGDSSHDGALRDRGAAKRHNVVARVNERNGTGNGKCHRQPRGRRTSLTSRQRRLGADDQLQPADGRDRRLGLHDDGQPAVGSGKPHEDRRRRNLAGRPGAGRARRTRSACRRDIRARVIAAPATLDTAVLAAENDRRAGAAPSAWSSPRPAELRRVAVSRLYGALSMPRRTGSAVQRTSGARCRAPSTSARSFAIARRPAETELLHDVLSGHRADDRDPLNDRKIPR